MYLVKTPDKQIGIFRCEKQLSAYLESVGYAAKVARTELNELSTPKYVSAEEYKPKVYYAKPNDKAHYTCTYESNSSHPFKGAWSGYDFFNHKFVTIADFIKEFDVPGAWKYSFDEKYNNWDFSKANKK